MAPERGPQTIKTIITHHARSKMNLRHPYEQLIADKLRQLPAPDADASWQQMKRLLDDNEDRGGGGRKRPPEAMAGGTPVS